MMIGYDIYDHFTMEHFRLRQSMILTSFFLLATVVYIIFFLNNTYVFVLYFCVQQNFAQLYR
jgi:hypothetical protein